MVKRKKAQCFSYFYSHLSAETHYLSQAFVVYRRDEL